MQRENTRYHPCEFTTRAIILLIGSSRISKISGCLFDLLIKQIQHRLNFAKLVHNTLGKMFLSMYMFTAYLVPQSVNYLILKTFKQYKIIITGLIVQLISSSPRCDFPLHLKCLPM